MNFSSPEVSNNLPNNLESKENFLLSLDTHVGKMIHRIEKDRQAYNNPDRLIQDIQNFHEEAKTKFGILNTPEEFYDYEDKYQDHIKNLMDKHR